MTIRCPNFHEMFLDEDEDLFGHEIRCSECGATFKLGGAERDHDAERKDEKFI